jgi:hypothetical protein
LEINKRLYVAALYLYDQKYQGYQNQCLSYQRHACHATATCILPAIRTPMKHISYSHQHEYFPVSFYELYEQFGMERSEYLTNHRYRTFEFGVTEEYPAETYEMEGNDGSKKSQLCVGV